jgi:hypothetical protein
MTITADSAVSNGRLRASGDTQPPTLTPPFVVPLRALGARSGARAPAWARAGAADGRARSEAALRGPDARLMMLQRPLWSLLCDHYFRLEVSGWERLPAETSLLVGVHPDNGMWVGKISSETPSGTPSVTGTVTPRRRLPNLPIVPVATVGGHDTVFVLSEGCFLAARVGGFRCSGKGAQRCRP